MLGSLVENTLLCLAVAATLGFTGPCALGPLVQEDSSRWRSLLVRTCVPGLGGRGCRVSGQRHGEPHS